MKIYDKSDALLLDIIPDDNSYRNRVIMGENSLVLYFSLPTHIELPIGAYCRFEGETYTLMRPEQFKMKHSRAFEYTVTFSSNQDRAKIWKFRNPVDGRLKFPLTAKPKEHLQMFIDNMNRRDTGWTIGECIEDTEKLISYDHDFCWDALTKIATEFETEFEIKGKQVSLHKVEYNKNNPLPLAYGRGNGFKPGIGRSNTSEELPVEILFVQGGDRNIDRSKYPSDEQLRAISNGCLLLPPNQTLSFDGEHFEGEDGYDPDNARRYIVDNLGLSIRNADRDLTTMAEDSLDRSDDYPKREGTISSVVVVDAEKNFYDIIDTSIPENLNYEDYLIGEEQMTIIFQSGELAGREFDVKYYHEAKTINGTTKAGRRFEIVPQEIDGVMMPGGNFIPAAENKYAVYNVMLPDAYICDNATKTGAEWDMFRAAVKYLFDNEQRKFSFTGELDGIWAKKDWVNIGGRIILGGFIRFTDERFEPNGVLVRITAIKDTINNPHSPKITLSNETVSGSVSSTLKTLQSTEVIIDENHRSALQFTKRRFRDAQETITMLEAALLDNFTSSISPVAVQTMSLLVGDESLQFVFTNTSTSDEVVQHSVVYNQENQKLTVDTSYIKHMTLGISTIKETHANDEYLRWTLPAFESPALSEGEKSFYLYAKVSETEATGTFILEETSKPLNPGDGFYYLLVGILNSEYDGERSFATLYGFTEVLPGRITTDQIVSNDGKTYFHLTQGEIGGKIKFKAGSSGLENVEGYDALTQSIADAQDAADNAQTTADNANTAVGNLNTYVDNAFKDGVVTEAEARRIKSYLNIINNTKLAVQSSYTQLYSNEFLTGTPKSDLETKYNALMTSITSLVNCVSSVIADGKATAAEASAVDYWYEQFNTAYANYQESVEVALNSIVDAVNAKADAAQTTADQAVQDAADAQATAGAAQLAADAAAASVSDLETYVDGAFKDGIVDISETEAIRTYLKTIDTQKAAVDAAYTKLYGNEYLLDSSGDDSTEKTTLATKKTAYNTAYTNLSGAINTVIADGKVSEAEKTAVNNKFKTYETAYNELSTAIEAAYSYIYSRILTTADASAKEDVAKLGETIIEGGYIKTNLINVDELIARHVIAGIDGGQRIELNPDTKRILVVSEDGTTTMFEGNQYDTPIASLFGGTGGTLEITNSSGSIASSTSGGTSWKVVSSAFHTDNPVEVSVNGFLQATASCDQNPTTSSSGGTTTIQPIANNNASISVQYYIRTYDSADCTNCIDTTLIASVQAYANGMPDINGNYLNTYKSSSKTVNNARAVVPVGGYHRLEVRIVRSATNGQTSGAWGYVSGVSTSQATSGSYSADFYVSRFFNNGFLLGTRSNNYILAYKNGNSMEFIMENNGNGFKFSSAGLQYKKDNGEWTDLV